MGRNDTKRIEVRATEDELEQAQEFVESLLDNPSINSEIASETEVIFEAVFSLILMQGFSSDTIIDISGEKKLGGLSLKIGFDGKRFNLADDGEGGTSPEMRILEGFAEKVSHSYHRGYNVIRIAVKSTPRAFLISCGGGLFVHGRRSSTRPARRIRVPCRDAVRKRLAHGRPACHHALNIEERLRRVHRLREKRRFT